MTPAFSDAHLMTSLIDTLAIMRDQRAQLAIVSDRDRPVGFLALEDLLEQVIGNFYDETDRPWGTPRTRRG
jgi:CBS domain containing-hemolysin-like protein